MNAQVVKLVQRLNINMDKRYIEQKICEVGLNGSTIFLVFGGLGFCFLIFDVAAASRARHGLNCAKLKE